MKKVLLSLVALPVLALVSGCNNPPTLDKVALQPALRFSVESGYQNEMAAAKAAMDNEDSFMLAVYGEFCSCSTVFHSVLMDYMNEYHLPFYEVVKNDNLLYDYGLPIADETIDLPIFAIFEAGVPKYTISYDSGDRMFLEEASFIPWVEARISFTKNLLAVSKAEFDTMLTGTESFVAYYSLKGCPDCAKIDEYLFPYLNALTASKPVYIVETLQEGFRFLDGEGTSEAAKAQWTTAKNVYGLSNVINTTYGFSTGFVPTFQYLVPDGSDHLALGDLSPIIEDMAVIFNEKAVKGNDNVFRISSTYYDGTRTHGYMSGLPLQINQVIPTADVYDSDKVQDSYRFAQQAVYDYYTRITKAFMDLYLPQAQI